MATKTFLRSTGIYEADNRRLQNDIEITGATITHSNGRPTVINFGGGGGGVDFSSLQSFANNADAVSAIGVGQLYKSSTLSINGSPQILITV